MTTNPVPFPDQNRTIFPAGKINTVDNANALSLATDLAKGEVSASILVTPTQSLLALISSGQVSLNQPATSATVASPIGYAGS